ncbi:MAG: YfiR family protein [Chlorobi bacterium]|nr:YfiR family protein [Chlorobiota bacterium]
MRKLILLLVLVAVMPSISNAQGEIPKYKSIFTLSFIRYIGWPEETKQGDFVIGVVKNKEVAEWLRNLSKGKKFGFQNVVIKEFRSPEDVTDCQVLYVSSAVNLPKYAQTLVEKVGGKNTLIISERNGATKYGSMINFVIKDNKLKFEIQKRNAAQFGLQISSKLGGMASAITL